MKYVIDDTTLKNIANAIREKTGSIENIYPTDMPKKIKSISGIGSLAKGVQFIDPFGNIIEEWPYDEIATKNELPTVPAAKNLIPRGWNWTLNEIKEYIQSPGFTSVLHVGAEYDTPNDELRMFLDIPININSQFYFRFYSPTDSVIEIYWDAKNYMQYPERISLLGGTTTLIPHYFNKLPYKYEVVARKVSGQDPIYLCPKNNSAYSMFVSGTKLDTDYNNDTQFAACLTDIYVGKNFRLGQVPFAGHVNLQNMVISEVDPSFPFKPCYFTYGLKNCVLPRGILEIEKTGFNNCVALEKISIPPTLMHIKNTSTEGPFNNCRKLKQISFPSSSGLLRGMCSNAGGIEKVNFGVYSNPDPNLFNSSDFYNNSNIEYLYIPDGPLGFGINFVNNCYNLKEIRLPETITNISVKAFYNCRNLKYLEIPASVIDLGTPYDASSGELFNMCRSLQYIRFKSTTPPTAYTSKTFEGLPTKCIIYVPEGTLSAYQSANNYPYSGTYVYKEWVDEITFFLKASLSEFDTIEVHCPGNMTWREFCSSGYSRFMYNGKEYAWSLKNENEMAIWDYSNDNYAPNSEIRIMGDWDSKPQEGQIYIDWI